MRAVQLAIVYLTRRDDIAVQNPLPDTGLDLMVALTQDGRNTGRYFGVTTEAAVSGQRNRNAFKQPDALRYVPFPVCLFRFDMTSDAAQWRWLRQPVEDADWRLLSNQDATLAPLTDNAISEIVQAVQQWYEQRK